MCALFPFCLINRNHRQCTAHTYTHTHTHSEWESSLMERKFIRILGATIAFSFFIFPFHSPFNLFMVKFYLFQIYEFMSSYGSSLHLFLFNFVFFFIFIFIFCHFHFQAVCAVAIAPTPKLNHIQYVNKWILFDNNKYINNMEFTEGNAWAQ